jgi:hypothetical protein
MRAILKLKHWQVFLYLVTGLLINNFTIEGNPSLTASLTIIGALIYFSWPLLVGHALYQLLPERINVNYSFFHCEQFCLDYGVRGYYGIL